MKYTIQGFNHEEIINLRLTSDEITLLRWFVDFRNTESMTEHFDKEENRTYYWILYDKAIEDLKYMFTSDKEDSNKKKLQRLLNGNLSKILDKKIIKNKKGTYTYFALNKKVYSELLSKSTRQKCLVQEEPTGQKCPPISTGQKCPMPTGQKCPPKDTSINIYSINNNSISKSKIIFNYLEQKNIRLSSIDIANVNEDLNIYDKDIFIKAIDETISKDIFSYNYTRKILQSLHSKKQKKDENLNNFNEAMQNLIQKEG